MRIIPKIKKQYRIQLNFKSGRSIRVWTLSYTIKSHRGGISALEYRFKGTDRILGYDFSALESVEFIRTGKYTLSWSD